MRVLETKVYTFTELSDDAKENARDWWRRYVFSDSNDWEFVYEDAANVAEQFGLDLRTRRVNQKDGGYHYDPCIYFSGFSNQGDGACYEGNYEYMKGALKTVKSYAPRDTELHKIVEQLQEIQRKNFYRVHARTKYRGHYCHSGCMTVEVGRSDDQPVVDEDDVVQLLREFADWIYEQLKCEYDYQCSNEVVDEMLIGNAYEFTEEGARA